jgi:hypothetical protein
MVYHCSRRVIWTVAIILILARVASGQGDLRVDEAAARIHIEPQGKNLALVVALPVENPSAQTIRARAVLELIDPRGKVESQAEQDVSLRPLSSKLRIPLPPLHAVRLDENTVLGFYRLRYSLASQPPGPAKTVEGIISVGQITPQLFELHVAGPLAIRAAGRSTLRVRAIQPVTARPVEGVTVQASLDLEEPFLTRKAVTGRDGFATLEFSLPREFKADENQIDVTVTGTWGGLSTEADGTLYVQDFSTGSLSTDKPLYQPGQTLHMRLLAFGDNQKALADQPAKIEVRDPDETLQYVTHVRTSRFGIAAADWQIPENLRLGSYAIRATFDDERYGRAGGFATVKVSRYELPTFTVTAKPDRSYYLPEQNATVEVRADYLFGKPVRHGHVRVVRENHREWDYREQKWDIEEGATYEGDTNDQGRYVAHLDLTRDHDELAGEDYERFSDLHLAAYFTDASTRRTEQRRFDIRISQEPIHVYVIGEDSGPTSGLPLDFFVSTDYADGSPAPCDVQLSWVVKPHKNAAGLHAILEQPLRRIHTNRYGLARVSGLKIPDDPAYGDAYLSLRATSRSGSIGHHSEELRYSFEPALRVATDKTLYRPQDPIEVTLTSNRRDLTVFVEAIGGHQVLTSQTLRMMGGRANLLFPSNDGFHDEVTIFAYGFENTTAQGDSRSALSGSHTVLFPERHDLQVEVRPGKLTYRPGDDASVDFRVTGPGGESLPSALGLVVVDKALEERQRTDEDFGHARGFYGFRGTWDDEEECKGVRRRDLNKLDLSRPLPEGWELVAEVLLRGRDMYPSSFESDADKERLRQVFAHQIEAQILPVRKALELHYLQTGEYPKTLAGLDEDLAKAGIQFEKLRDPWSQPYHAEFSVRRESDVLEIKSAGPDKKMGTEDDLTATPMTWPYFKAHADSIQQAVNAFHNRTGGYIRDAQALKSELALQGLDSDSWKDPWGHRFRYTFGVATTQFTITVTSAGPDGRFSTEAEPSDDDFAVATVGNDYTVELQDQLDRALTRYVEENHQFPQNTEELQKALQNAGIAWDSLKDPWGHRYYATFRQEAMYADQLTVERYAERGQPQAEHTRVVPVTRQMNWLYIRCAGQDGIEGTADDFTIAAFSRAILEQSSHNPAPVPARDQAILPGATGAISGTVTDASGAVVAGAVATAKNLVTDQLYTEKTGDDGKYILRNLPAGTYYVEVSMPGFRVYAITDVPVRSSNVTALDVTLQVGSVTQTVMVSANVAVLETQSTSVTVQVKPRIGSESLHPANSTPRLRDYFPETLLWQPELVTDNKGHAHLKFPLAGNITTWKLAAVASTVSGEIGTAEKEIRAFQPFFIDHDPPRFLTTGDEIDLPVVLRNYLDHALQAKVEMGAQSWYTLANPAAQVVDIAPNDSASKVFRFTAVAPVKQGKQRVTARSNDAADAIEKTVTVRPNGQEEVQSLSEVFREKAGLDLQIPNTMVPGSLEASVKIYPNLNAHVLESLEAIMRRPYGCAEQAISSAYPALLYLRYAGDANDKNSEMSARARRYVQLGYDRLLSYQDSEGGFSYWGRGEADPALTAYALKFLTDANAYVTVDPSVIKRTLSWLLNHVQPDGRWVPYSWWDKKEDSRASAQLTAYIARAIAMSKLPAGGDDADKVLASKASEEVQKALKFVEPHAASLDEPYLIAAYTLAALDAGQPARAAAGIERLRKLEHHEGDTSYWSLEMNTPFYGWGLAGRLETTALVVQALERDDAARGQHQEPDEMVSRGLLFLLKNPDQYGVWYSTQATVNVLDAIAAFTAPQEGKQEEVSAASKAEILIDGQPAVSVDLPAGNMICSPVVEDLSRYLSPGTHHLEIRRPAGSSGASLQLVADYYVPWTHTGVASNLHHETGAAEALRLAVQFDKSSATPGESINCNVVAERIGFRGYGMMLAEIGLPPGAEVDRASLEKAMTASDWDINQYDILPDRAILYLWPHAGGVKLSFTFRFRYGLKALTAPSILYDYYNPLARAEVEPTQFLVQ